MDISYELYNAVKTGNTEKTKDLINNGADVNYVFLPDEYGITPLHWAAYFAKNDTIKLLIDNGANVNAYSLEGKTPLDFAVERHNRIETVDLLLSSGAINGTVPVPDFASIGDVFLTSENKYLLIGEDGKIQEYQKHELNKLMENRKLLSRKGEEVEISFVNDRQSNIGVYYAFSLPKRKMISEDKMIPEYINTREHPNFKLALVTDEIAVYVNPGDDVLTMDLHSGTIMDDVSGVKKYHEIMGNIINNGKKYEYGDLFVFYCKKSRGFENNKSHNQEENDSQGNIRNRRRGR